MSVYVRITTGDKWHIADPEALRLVAVCGRELGTNPREKHRTTKPKEPICYVCSLPRN